LISKRNVRTRGFSYRNLFIASALAALAASSASAETLREALVAAYETNPSLTAAREGQKATDEGVPLAKANGRPNADLQPTYTENVINSAGAFSQARSFSATGTVAVPIYQGGGVKNAIRAAETRVEAGRAGLRGTESAIFSAVVGAYMDVIRDEAIVGLNRAQVGVLQVNLEATKDRFEIGDLTRTDVAQSEARLATAISQMEGARSNLIRSKEVYIQLVGRAPDNLEAPPPLPNLPETPTGAVDIALRNNPDIIAAGKASEAARYDRKGANSVRLPSVSAFSQARYNNALGSQSVSAQNFQDNATFDNSIGLRATIPLYQGGRPAAQIRQAQARLGQLMEQEIGVEREVIAQTRAAYASWKASLEVIESSERAVAANELSLEGVRAENSVGNRTILDILNAEQELLSSKVNLVTARRNAYVAGFSLLAAMGKAEARDLSLEGGTLYDPVEYYDRVDNAWNDWSTNPDPVTKATRNIDTEPQKAEIEPLAKNSAEAMRSSGASKPKK
jgi:outer membrane protein